MITLPRPELSCVVLGWNDYPLIVDICEILQKELEDISHEIIVVNNGSTDKTKDWLDTVDGIKPINLPDNRGAGFGMNVGLEAATGNYIFFIDGDKLPTLGTVKALLEYIKAHPDISYLGINAWVGQDQTINPLWEGFESKVLLGLGNYAYAYAIIRREVIDNGVRFADTGIFAMPGCNYQDIDFAYGMYARGMKGYLFGHPWYYHAHKKFTLEGYPEGEQSRRTIERKKYLTVRWNKIDYGAVHYNTQPPERHLRQIALMKNSVGIDPAYWIEQEFKKMGCIVDRYRSLEKPTKEYDNYIFMDDGDWEHFTCPEWAHPSKYWAMDFYYPYQWPASDPINYVNKGKTFDEFYSATKTGFDFCIANGLKVRYLPFAASTEMHKPYPGEEVVWDWIAAWHNCGARIEYANAAAQKFPNGIVGYFVDDNYARQISRARCALNVSRVNEVNQRVLEVMAIGVPLITDRVQGLDNYGLVENEHYRGHASVEEMLEQIQWVKDNPEEAQAMAARARAFVLANHTYYWRALEMFA